MSDVWLAVVYILFLTVFASLPIIVDIVYVYRARREAAHETALDRIVGLIELQGASKINARELRTLLEEFRTLVKEIRTPPSGITGLGRQTMALTILVILGIVLFHALVVGIPETSARAIDNALSVLSGALAAIIGFYYGGKAAERKPGEAAEKAEEVPIKPAETAPSAGTIQPSPLPSAGGEPLPSQSTQPAPRP